MLLEFCKECGKCCDIIKEMPLFLSKKEYGDLKNAGYEFEVFDVDEGYIINDTCPFVSDKGCTLPKELKPLDCEMFPLAFVFKNGKFEFYLNKKCPYWDKISKEWIEKTRKEFFKKIKNRDKRAMEIYGTEKEDYRETAFYQKKVSQSI